MQRPNFFIVGAPKCGTTSWSDYLAAHSQVQRSRKSEPHFFCSDFGTYRTTTSLSEYLGSFDASQRSQVRFDCSPLYLYSDEAILRIRDFNADARILILLRKQSSFLPSWHNQLLYSLNENIRDFDEAWRLSGCRTRANSPSTCRTTRVLNYRQMGHFRWHVERCLEIFPPEQVRVAWMEDWRPDAAGFNSFLHHFLGLVPETLVDYEVLNQAHRNRSAYIGRIVHRPPAWLSLGTREMKRILGIRSLGIGPMLRRMNRVVGSSNVVFPELRAEIAELYDDDNRALNKLLREKGCLYQPSSGAISAESAGRNQATS